MQFENKGFQTSAQQFVNLIINELSVSTSIFPPSIVRIGIKSGNVNIILEAG
jgi:hypothetical protein